MKDIQGQSLFSLKKDLMAARFKAAFGEAVSSSSIRSLKKQVVLLVQSR